MIQWTDKTLGEPRPLPNVWLGVSVENQQAADERIPYLLQTPAAVRFIIAEPLLEDVNLQTYFLMPPRPGCPYIDKDDGTCKHLGNTTPECHYDACPMPDRQQPISWVIVGGESGPGCRPMDIEWARHLKLQCEDASVPFFMKQLGGHPNKRGDLEDFPEDLRVREWPSEFVRRTLGNAW